MKLSSSAWDLTFKREILSASNALDFLGRFVGPAPTLEAHASTNRPKKISYAELSRRAGFSSRAFIRDVLLGTKNLSRESCEKIAVALGLTGLWKKYFLALHETENGGDKKRAVLNQIRAQLLKSGPTRRSYSKGEKNRVRKLLAVHVPAVFAACGTETEGATDSEIINRTRLSALTVSRALQSLTELDLVHFSEGRYRPCFLHLAYEKLGSEEFFLQDFESNSRAAVRRLSADPHAKDMLNFTSTFSVRSSDLPALANRLRGVLEEFVNQSEVADGDRIADLVLGFGPFQP